MKYRPVFLFGTDESQSTLVDQFGPRDTEVQIEEHSTLPAGATEIGIANVSAAMLAADVSVVTLAADVSAVMLAANVFIGNARRRRFH